MTAQVSDTIHFQGKERRLFSTPLDAYLQANPSVPEFVVEVTCNWRGYWAKWVIEDDRLYVTEIKGKQRSSQTPASLQTVFPGAGDRVFAEWYSGELHLPQGEVLRRRNSGFGAVHDEHLVLMVDKGRVVGSRVNTLEDSMRSLNIPPIP